MTVTEDTKSGEIHLVFIMTHHEPGLNEVKYLPLPNATQKQVKEHYDDGVDLDKIIDGSRIINYLHYFYKNITGL